MTYIINANDDNMFILLQTVNCILPFICSHNDKVYYQSEYHILKTLDILNIDNSATDGTNYISQIDSMLNL